MAEIRAQDASQHKASLLSPGGIPILSQFLGHRTGAGCITMPVEVGTDFLPLGQQEAFPPAHSQVAGESSLLPRCSQLAAQGLFPGGSLGSVLGWHLLSYCLSPWQKGSPSPSTAWAGEFRVPLMAVKFCIVSA